MAVLRTSSACCSQFSPALPQYRIRFSSTQLGVASARPVVGVKWEAAGGYGKVVWLADPRLPAGRINWNK